MDRSFNAIARKTGLEARQVRALFEIFVAALAALSEEPRKTLRRRNGR